MINIKFFLLLFITTLNLYSLDFKVASYNVENFFDLQYDKTEYKEYIPNTQYWNKKAFTNKLHNISKTIHDLDADVLALQEVESKIVVENIIKKNQKYKYFKFIKNKSSAVGLALLSKYPIIKTKNIKLHAYEKYSRDILKATLSIENRSFIIYVNHWRSKRAKESKRIKYALALKMEINTLRKEEDYIVLGDLNSNYNEYQTFKYDKKLNDTYNITGINQILNTTIDENFVQKNNILNYDENVLFNTWLELPKHKRYSAKFKQQNNTPDNILLSPSLFDAKNISYINNSFNVFTKKYLFKKSTIFRWNKSKYIGYSDHLPIYAFFSTKKQSYNFKKNVFPNHQNTIEHLYKVQQISNYFLKNVTVIYKSKKIAILKQNTNGKAIMLYKPAKKLKKGESYNFVVNKIDEFNGLKEIVSISNISHNKSVKYSKKFYLDAKKVNIFDHNLVNNIIENLEGVYKKKYLYFGKKKIQLYFTKGVKKPKEGSKIFISSGHLGIFRSTIQIVLHKQSDFREL